MKKDLNWLVCALADAFAMPKASFKIFAWCGVVGHPWYYAIWRYLTAEAYDNLGLRLLGSAVCVPMLFQDKFLKYFPERVLALMWAVTVTITLPFLFSFFLLMNDFQPSYLLSIGLTILFVMMLFRSVWASLISLTVGFVSGVSLFGIVSLMGFGALHYSLFIQQLPIFGFAFLFGAVLNHGRRENERLIASNLQLKEELHKQKELELRALAGTSAHEIRNPLGQIREAMTRIEKVLPNPRSSQSVYSLSAYDANEMLTGLARMDVAMERGLQVIDMTLDEVSEKPLNPENMAYTYALKLVDRVYHEFSYPSQTQKNAVTVNALGEDFILFVNETKLVHVMFNLIKNSLHYFETKPDFRITIYIDGANNRLRVHDNGPGMPKEVLDHLFESFKTVGKKGGTGLGLPYAKRVVESFGGTITCDSSLGNFTEFTITFPAVTAEEMHQAEQELREILKSRLAGQRVLVVDDMPEMLDRIQVDLKGICRVDTADDGTTALEKLKVEDYAIVLMDITMNTMDGYEATEHIRRDDIVLNPNVPILAHTAEPPYLASTKIRKVGMDHFVHKPCTQFELLRAINICLDKSKERSNMQAIKGALAGKAVVIVDDEQFNREVILAYLSPYGMTTTQAASGKALIDYLEGGNRPDAILMDLQMPGMNGCQAAQLIRERSDIYGNIPLIAVSGDSFEDVIASAMEAGFNEYLVKPFMPENLLLKISKALKVKTDPSAAPQSLKTQEQKIPRLARQMLSECKTINETKAQALIDRGMADNIREVLTAIRRYMSELIEAVEKSDIVFLRKIFHGLASSTGMIYAEAFAKGVRIIGEQIHDNKWPEDPDWLESLKVLHQVTVEAFKTTFGLEAF